MTSGCDTAPHARHPASGITIGMARNAAQSDFVVETTPPPVEPVELPAGADVVELPRAIWRTPFASARATKIVFTVMFAMLIVLAVLMLVGLHVPAGE